MHVMAGRNGTPVLETAHLLFAHNLHLSSTLQHTARSIILNLSSTVPHTASIMKPTNTLFYMHEIYKKHDIKKKEDMEQCIVKEAEKKRNEAEAILQNTHWIPGGKREQWITFITYSPTTVDEQREANKKKLIAWMHHGRVTMNAIMRNNVRNHCSPPITTSTVGFSMVIENPLKKGTAPCLTTNGQRDGLPDEEKLWVACSRSKAGGNEYFETCTTEALEHGNYRLGLYMFFNSFDKNIKH